MCMVSNAHSVSAPGKYISIVSTTLETKENPLREIEAGINLLGPIMERYGNVHVYRIINMKKYT